MIIQHQDKSLINIYRCPMCGECFGTNGSTVYTSCLVMHAPGSCCHHGEKSVSEEKIDTINRIMEAE